jgi:hypothetical protein
MPNPKSEKYDVAAGRYHPECCFSRCERPGMAEDCERVGLERCVDGNFTSGIHEGTDTTCPDIPTVHKCRRDGNSADICECCKCSEHGTEAIWSRNESPQKYHCVDLPESVEDFFCSPKSHDDKEVKQCRVKKNNEYRCHMLPEYIEDQRELTGADEDDDDFKKKVDKCCITHWRSNGEVKQPVDFQNCCEGENGITC